MILDDFRLDGKNALVTGSSRGLGAGIAVALAEAGANVAVHGREAQPDRTAEQVRAAGGETLRLTGDVAEAGVCQQLIDAVLSDWGSLDILVNNAGIIRRSPAAQYPVETWYEVIETNLTSVFRMCQLAGGHMLERGNGKIINLASLLSFEGGILVSAYAAAKGGVAQLTKALANEWAPQGVNVNAIAPGYMATDNTAPLRADPVRSRQLLERIPAGRWGAGPDLGGAAVYLASAASDYVHGHLLVVDGGWLAR